MAASPVVESEGARARSPVASTRRNDPSILAIPKVRLFLDSLIEGDDLTTAARKHGLRIKRARAIIRDPAVRRVFFREIEVLRDSTRARQIHVAAKILEKGASDDATAAQQKASLDAARFLQGDAAPGASTSVHVNVTNQVVGYVMDLREEGEAIPHRSADRAKPLIEHAPVGSGDE